MTSFSIPLDQLAAKLKLDLDTVVRKSTLDLFKAVVLKSPVDTGRFRANWNCTRGEPSASTTESVDQSRGISEAQKALEFATGDVVYFCNGLPYAYRLENEGWSKQAPAGMIKISVTEFDQYVRKAVSV